MGTSGAARIISWVATLLVISTPLRACLWDYDTLRDEKRGLPGVAEIIAGKWEKHSPFFYQQRVEQMKQLLDREPANLDAWDNLAVAYEKLGDRDKAIETILAKDKIKPGEYTTYANLGTFYLHKGDFDRGIENIEKALAINPDAHFGREEYQLKLAKFLRDGRRASLPATQQEQQQPLPPFADFLGVSFFMGSEDQPSPQPALIFAGDKTHTVFPDIKPNAIEGIVGMLRFGTGTSPDLWYALGNQLLIRGDKNLAYRAFGRAAEYEHPNAEQIRELMAGVAARIGPAGGVKTADIDAERADADAWVQAYQKYEDELVRRGDDPNIEKNYAVFYSAHGRAVNVPLLPSMNHVFHGDKAMFVGALALGIALLLIIVRWVTAYRRQHQAQIPVT